MNARTLMMLLVIAVIGLGGVYFGRQWLNSQRPAPQPTQVTVVEPADVRVLVAAQDIPTGHFIDPEDIRWQAWPEEGSFETYFVEGRNQESDIIGAVLRHPITVGDPITTGRIVRPGERGFVAAVLAPGMRAVSVPVDATTGVSGFVLPGDRVDVMLSHQMRDLTDQVRRATETVLLDVRVLAIDQNMNDTATTPHVAHHVTLEVLPVQAETLAVVTQIGRLSLALRSLAVAELDTKPRPSVMQMGAPVTAIGERSTPRSVPDPRPSPQPQEMRRDGSRSDGPYTFTIDSDVSALIDSPIGHQVMVVRGNAGIHYTTPPMEGLVNALTEAMGEELQ